MRFLRWSVAAFSLALVLATPAVADDGDFDPAFDGDGRFQYAEPGSYGSAMLRAPDDAVVVWGSRIEATSASEVHWRRVTVAGAGPLCTFAAPGAEYLQARGAAFDADGRLLASGHNRTIQDRDPTAHAEVVALRAAARRLDNYRLTGARLYVTLEPCPMCAGAISFARIRRLYYGAADPKGGAVDSGVRFFASPTCHHRPEVYPSVGEGEAAMLLRDFFKARR